MLALSHNKNQKEISLKVDFQGDIMGLTFTLWHTFFEICINCLLLVFCGFCYFFCFGLSCLGVWLFSGFFVCVFVLIFFFCPSEQQALWFANGSLSQLL